MKKIIMSASPHTTLRSGYQAGPAAEFNVNALINNIGE